MGTRPDSFMPIFWGDYARDTGHLNNSGHGAYLMLIKHYWASAAPLPDDDTQLWRIACCDSVGAWRKLRPAIERLFKTADGQWRHKRIDAEIAEAARRYEQRAEGARIANAKRGAQRNAKRPDSEADSDTLSERSPNAERDAERVAERDAIPPDKGALRALAQQPQPQPQPPSLRSGEGRSPAAHGARLAADWTLPNEWHKFAADEGMDPVSIEREARKFADFWHGKAGAGGRKADWPATWRNWIRRAMEDGQTRKTGIGEPPDALGRAREILRSREDGGAVGELSRGDDEPLLPALSGRR